MRYLTWKVLKELQKGQPRKMSCVTCISPYLLFQRSTLPTMERKAATLASLLAYSSLLFYAEHSHAAIAGQLCMLRIVPFRKAGVGFVWSQKEQVPMP